MIHVTPVKPPDDFDAKVRIPGNAWLVEHPNAIRPNDFWSTFIEHRWYEMYQNGKLTLGGLREVAPLIADAVERQNPCPI